MKRLLIVFALLTGIVGISQAVDRKYQGWNVTVVTGTVAEIFTGRGYLKAVVNSIADYDSTQTGYTQLFSSNPSNTHGAGVTLFPVALFVASAAVTPPIVFNTTVAVVSGGYPAPSRWDMGDCDTCFVEIDATGGLYLRKTAQASGGASQTAVYWSK